MKREQRGKREKREWRERRERRERTERRESRKRKKRRETPYTGVAKKTQNYSSEKGVWRYPKKKRSLTGGVEIGVEGVRVEN